MEHAERLLCFGFRLSHCTVNKQTRRWQRTIKVQANRSIPACVRLPNTHTHTGAVKADPAGIYFYTKHEEEGEVRRRCVVANDADPGLVTE